MARPWLAAGAAALCFSLLPAGYRLGVTDDAGAASPAGFATILVATTGLIGVLWPGPIRMWRRRTRIVRALRTHRQAVGVAAVCNLDRVVFAVALVYAGPWLATVIFEIWPIAMTIIGAFAGACHGIRKTIAPGPGLWLALALGLAGVAIATTGATNEAASATNVPVGVTVSLIAATMSGAYVCATREAAVRMDPILRGGAANDRLLSDGVAYTASKALMVTGLGGYATIATMAGVEVPGWQTAGWAVTTGIAAGTGSMLFRQAHRWADHDGINALLYVCPIAALGWLAVIDLVEGTRPAIDGPTLGGGLALILIGNVIAWRASRRPAPTG